MKTCRRCKKDLPLTEFYKDKSSKDKLTRECKQCSYERRKDYVSRNREKVRATKKKWDLENSKHIKEYRKKMYPKIKDRQKAYKKTEKYLKQQKRYRQENRETINKKRQEYEKTEAGKRTRRRYITKNRDKYNAKEAKRRATKKNATPDWSEIDKIKILYEKTKWLESITGLKYHVDHIVPLVNDNVCGLHVWANLQILESTINHKKNNKFNCKS
jgi:alpha-galactosidase/6-phospho-beta-glucosidase family protein